MKKILVFLATFLFCLVSLFGEEKFGFTGEVRQLIFEPTPDLRPGIPKGQASLVLSLLFPDV